MSAERVAPRSEASDIEAQVSAVDLSSGVAPASLGLAGRAEAPHRAGERLAVLGAPVGVDAAGDEHERETGADSGDGPHDVGGHREHVDSFADGVPIDHTAGVPEIIEVESYRRYLSALVGATVADVEFLDARYCRGIRPTEVAARLDGSRLDGLGRRGKVLLVDLRPAERLALRFGMTGRPFLTGAPAALELEYGSNRDNPSWDRLRCRLDDGRVWRINDPRCLGGVEDATAALRRLGPDAWSASEPDWDAICRGRAPIKARLLDQSVLAGLGNMLVDELLWRSGVDPRRPAGSLSGAERAELARLLVPMLDELSARGGSHLGDLSASLRVAGSRCPTCRRALERAEVGGRATFWCPAHQH